MSDDHDGIHVTEHARMNWFTRRRTTPDYGVRDAWRQSVTITDDPSEIGLEGAEARYHAETDLVFVIGEEPSAHGEPALVTVMRGEWAKWSVKEAIAEVTAEP